MFTCMSLCNQVALAKCVQEPICSIYDVQSVSNNEQILKLMLAHLMNETNMYKSIKKLILTVLLLVTLP